MSASSLGGVADTGNVDARPYDYTGIRLEQFMIIKESVSMINEC